MTELPIDVVLPELRAALAVRNGAVLQAPPGAGKTTRVPLALLDEPWLAGKKIVMLEPRRLAARNAALWMAGLRGEDAGGTVGYRTRLDTQVGARTRIEVVTEGVLARLLQDDPALEDYGCVIFDEFHERSVHTDTGLALCLDAQRTLRDDLRVLVMSATLDAAPVAKLLGDAPLITSAGRTFPVDIRYGVTPRREDVLAAVTRTVLDVLNSEPGSVLVFLPGGGEIRRVEEQLRKALPDGRAHIAPLYGDLPRDAQERAIAPSKAGERKVVLATAIAETSLTIEGVRVVIDSGLQRVPKFDPVSGMTRLETVRVSQAAAAQRAGRAGRTEPGVCYRLWSETEQRGLRAFNTPEILDADLAPLMLELAQWGVRDAAQLAWLDPPPAAAQAQARELLQRLDALDADGRITATGRKMAALALHPRLAHMVLRGVELGYGAVACELAALLGERDVLKQTGPQRDADVRTRLELLRRDGARDADRGALFQVRKTAQHWQRRLHLGASKPEDLHAAGLLLAFAYPDRIGQRRGATGYRYVLSNGRGAVLSEGDALAKADYLVAAELDGNEREARIFLGAPLSENDIEAHFAAHITAEDCVEWDSRAQAVLARRRRRLEQLVLRDDPLPSPDPERVKTALIQGIRERGLDVLPWSKAARQWQARVAFVHRVLPEQSWPDVSDAALLNSLEQWLGPELDGITRLDGLQRIHLMDVLARLLDWKQTHALDELAPTHLTVPTGSRIPVDYAADPPVLAVRLQEMFGCADTPRIAGGRVAVVLHLLSPAHRPVQVTRDLAGFWKTSYADVKKDMKGRYPKHPWPDDPLQAAPTRRAKPRGT